MLTAVIAPLTLCGKVFFCWSTGSVFCFSLSEVGVGSSEMIGCGVVVESRDSWEFSCVSGVSRECSSLSGVLLLSYIIYKS